MTWPVRSADNDRVPTDLALAYATPLSGGSAMRPEPMADTATRLAPAVTHDNVTTVAKKTIVRTASLDPVAARAEPAARAR